MAEELTEQQRSAVYDRGGNLLVSAAAGSGKTKVLVDRLLSYLMDPVKPENIDSFLMITYTKAAAAELRAKIASKLSEAIAKNPENKHLRKQMQRLYLTKISTVHSFCADILKEYAYMLDISADFRVADEKECIPLQAVALERVLNAAYEQAVPDPDFLAFVDSQGLGRDDRQVPQLVLSVYRKAKCHLDFEKWLNDCLKHCDVSLDMDLSQTVWGEYLIKDFKAYLVLQIQALSKCAEAAYAEGDMVKPAALLDDTVQYLKKMHECETWDAIYALRDIPFGTLNFGKKCQNTELVERIKVVRNTCKDALKKRLRRFSGPSVQLLGDIQSTQSATRGLIQLVRAFEKEYSKIKHQRRILDFGDLEHKTLDLLWGRSRAGITSIAREIGDRYCQIMVDEYQDSNAVQDAIFNALTAHKNNCFMVGDVKQSIYQFRLADPQIFLKKYGDYAPAENAQDGEGRKVLLSSNFRSGAAVLDAVNDVFYDCMYDEVGGLRYTEAEALSEGTDHVDIPEPQIELHGLRVQSDTYSEEAAYVASKIKEMLDSKCLVRDKKELRPVRAEDIVILLRSPGSVGRDFQIALEDVGVACSFDNGCELMEAEEIQFIRSLLQVISNPLQDIPLIAVLSSRVFGFTADELADIRSLDMKSNFYNALLKDQRDKTKLFLEILDRLRLDARMCTTPQLIDRILVLTDADAIFQSMTNGSLRSDNLRSFCTLATTYASVGQNTVEGFLQYLDIIAAEGYQVPGAVSTDSVRIMSIHKSKGLEFPVVFLCGLSKSFNMEQTRAQVLCDSEQGLGLSCVDSERRVRFPTIAKYAITAKMCAEALSEELRVLYVAMTRPKDRLVMTYAAKDLDGELFEMVARMDICDPVLMSGDVGSAGEWVLLAALRHSEAGSFHAVGGKPKNVRILKHPWKICIAQQSASDAPVFQHTDESSQNLDTCIEKMRLGLNYQYPYPGATEAPSKLTATQMKGRYKDQEAADGARRMQNYYFRKPEFIESRASGTQYGTAMHTVMQHLRFDECRDLPALEGQVKRLVEEGHITQKLSEDLNISDIYRFVQTDVGMKLQGGTKCIREFKFSVLDEAGRYAPDAEGEEILLQGVVDCALIEDDGITIVDFKTDRVGSDTLEASILGYSPQVRAYAYALEKIFKKPIKKAYLYYFRLGQLIPVDIS